MTPTQAKMLEMLADGKMHSLDELRSCLPDELGGNCNVRVHVSRIRKQLRPSGGDIVCRSSYYCWVRRVLTE
jgi:DNA-binding response OmpR family regulator